MPSLKNSLTILISELLIQNASAAGSCHCNIWVREDFSNNRFKKLFYNFKSKISVVNFTWHLDCTVLIVKTVT